jgi:hypothetical protein
MESHPVLALILPPLGKEEDIEKTVHSLEPLADRLQLIVSTDLKIAGAFPNLVLLDGVQPDTYAKLLNAALPQLHADFVGILQPGLEIEKDLIDILENLGVEGRSADYLYGDYYRTNATGDCELVQSNPCPDDITEREDWGPLELYRVEALREIGGCEENLRFRADYDLRLSLTLQWPALHLPKPLCVMPYTESEGEPGAEALFFPGHGKFGGFSYLFMDPEEEKETEEIFYRALKRRNAYLDGSSDAIFPKSSPVSPRVSVIIPVHNRAKFLPLAVQSIQRGNFTDFEIIIIDNASTDDTLSVAENLAAEDSRISVIPLPDNVIARALNRGIKAARGEYIAQLDSDDEYTPDTLEVMVSHLDRNRDWALAISYYELMDEGGTTLDEFGVIKHLEYNRNNILRVDGAGAVRVWRRAAIEEFGGFNERDFGHYGEDYDLVLKVGEKYEVGRVHQVLYRYRRHPGNSDILRPHQMKIENKTLARMRAIERRRALNQSR